jgi:hypothetical protein
MNTFPEETVATDFQRLWHRTFRAIYLLVSTPGKYYTNTKFQLNQRLN